MKIKKTVISTFGESSSSFRPGVEHFANHPFFLDALYVRCKAQAEWMWMHLCAPPLLAIQSFSQSVSHSSASPQSILACFIGCLCEQWMWTHTC